MSTVCLCRRAGKLEIGFDAVCAEISGNNKGGALLAADVSAKTEKEIRFLCEKHNREVLKAEFTMDDAKKAVGKRAGVFFIADEGLFGAVKRTMLSDN